MAMWIPGVAPLVSICPELPWPGNPVWKDTTDISDTKSKVTGAGFRERVRNACDVTLEVEPVPVEIGRAHV